MLRVKPTVLRVKSSVLRVKAMLLRVKPSLPRVKPFVLPVKRCHIYKRNWLQQRQKFLNYVSQLF